MHNVSEYSNATIILCDSHNMIRVLIYSLSFNRLTFRLKIRAVKLPCELLLAAGEALKAALQGFVDEDNARRDLLTVVQRLDLARSLNRNYRAQTGQIAFDSTQGQINIGTAGRRTVLHAGSQSILLAFVVKLVVEKLLDSHFHCISSSSDRLRYAQAEQLSTKSVYEWLIVRYGDSSANSCAI